MKSKDKTRSMHFSPPPPVNPYQVPVWSTGAIVGETPDQARARILATERAVETSKDIDRYLLESKKQLDRRKRAIKVLLLGQSESGKSSVLKNFQLAFAPRHFDSERPLWKVVIQLNLIGTIKTILEALKDEYEPAEGRSAPTGTSQVPFKLLQRMRLSLSPLFFMESNLLKILASEPATDSTDLTVRAGFGWKTLLLQQTDPFSGGVYAGRASSDDKGKKRSSESKVSVDGNGITLNPDYDPTTVLAAQKDDILELWESEEVQKILKRRRPLLSDTPGFFMNDIARIATTNYIPTDTDIIRARIKTMGVEEHQFVVEKTIINGITGRDMKHEFIITDVGGARHQRASWAPFFDDVQAILFLAPLAFNRFLAEEKKVNRLEDSLYLWRDLCSNKLLQHANLILFFNKMDILAATLEAGAKVKKYVPTFGDLPNDVQTVTKYFKDKFRLYHRKCSPESRPFFCYETSAVDIQAMNVLLTGVRESILWKHLRDGDMI